MARDIPDTDDREVANTAAMYSAIFRLLEGTDEYINAKTLEGRLRLFVRAYDVVRAATQDPGPTRPGEG